MSIEHIEPSKALIDLQVALHQAVETMQGLQSRLHRQKEIVAQAKVALTKAEAHADKTLALVAMGEREDADLTAARKALSEARIELSDAEDMLAGQKDASKVLTIRRQDLEAGIAKERRKLLSQTVEARRRDVLADVQASLEDAAALLALNTDMFDLGTYLNHEGIIYNAHQAGVQRASAAIRELSTAGERYGL